MKHPFDLESPTLQTLDLDFLEPLTKEEMQSLDGASMKVTTQALGKEGGTKPPVWSLLSRLSRVSKPPESKLTTLALGEEGG
jgi:hypothetical protein